jgi:KUP system potassium uptake protein
MGDGVPPVYENFIRKFEALPEIQILLHLRALSRPYVSEEDKFTISRTSLPNCYRVVIRHGYNDIVVTERLGDIVYEQLKQFLVATPSRSQPSATASGAESAVSGNASREVNRHSDLLEAGKSERVASRLAKLEAAYEAQTVYVCVTHCSNRSSYANPCYSLLEKKNSV